MLIGILVLILAACARPATSLTPSRVTVSTTPPSDTHTTTPQPSNTPGEALGRATFPSLNPSRTATRTPTQPPTAIPSDTPDSTAVLATLEALRTDSEIHRLVSPDGKWQAELVTQFCVQVGSEMFIFYQLGLGETDSSTVRVLFQDLGGCGLGYPSYELTAWSPNSSWLYYTYRVIPDGDALIIPGTTYRVEAASGESTPLPSSGPVSPDQTKMAWVEGSDLVLYDLDNGEMQTFPEILPADLFTYLVWQPEGTGIVFVQTEQNSYAFGSSTVGLITLEGMTVRILHEGDDPALIALQGFEAGGILMGDIQGRTWFLSIPDGKLTQR